MELSVQQSFKKRSSFRDLSDDRTEGYLAPYQTSTVVLFCKNSSLFLHKFTS